MSLNQRIELIKKEIDSASAARGNKAEKARIICVTKYAKIEDVIEIVRLGCYDIAENYLQELERKSRLLKQALSPEQFAGINWHFIGHLQRNKAAEVIRFAKLIQSVDSLRLAQWINEIGAKENKKINILLQINISSEQSKFGVSFDQAEKLFQQILTLPNIDLQGLMGIGPLADGPEDSRPGFKQLKQCFDKMNADLADRGYPVMEILSMGMSNDYKVALEEGSTMIRVGSAIFEGE